MRNVSDGSPYSRGFARKDLLVSIAVVFALGVLAWAGILLAGEQRRIWTCAHRMKTLGSAFMEYASDHKGLLPPAVLEDGQRSVSWDREIAVYLEPELRKQNSPETQKTLEAKAAPAFKCPSDREPRGGAEPRSYSMPAYDINRAGWPPKENSEAGLGLYLDAKTLAKARKTMLMDSSDYVPTVKISSVPAPADTALLVERISILNALWATKFACIVSTKEQFDAKTLDREKFHYSKMNYLMLDGHVELLLPAQSAGFTGNGGLWTLRADD
jgi:prepilin-type processing-associated H-X9-DG protein